MSGDNQPGGGEPALLAASGYLTELISAIEALNSRSMFYVGISVAANSLFVAVIASLQQPWEVGVVPVVLTLLAVGIGLWSLWVRALPQFPDPAFLKEGEGLGVDDDEVAWAVVSAIAASCSRLEQSLRRVSRVSRVLAILTAAQLLSATATGAFLVL